MTREARPHPFSPWRLKWMLSLYPPLLLGGVRVLEFGDDFRTCRVRVARLPWTRNLHGSLFGGTIFSAADPFYALMYWQILAHRGHRVQAWLKSARIEYRKPASTALSLEFRLTETDVETAAAELTRRGRFEIAHPVEAVDRSGDVCAVVETTVFLRLPTREQREVSAF